MRLTTERAEAVSGRSHTTGTIKQSVSSLDGVVDGIRAGGVVDFPQTEAYLGHLVAIVQRHVWCVDSHCCEEVAIRKGGSE